MERRRSSRVPSVSQVSLTGTDMEGQRFQETTWTISINKHGAKLPTFRRLWQGDPVTILNRELGQSADAKVVSVAEKGSGYELGVELATPQNVWGLPDPPADWNEATVAQSPIPSAEPGTNGSGAQQGGQSSAPSAKSSEVQSEVQMEPEAQPEPEGRVEPPPAEIPNLGTPAAEPAASELGSRRAGLERLFENTQEALMANWQAIRLYRELEEASGRFVEDARNQVRQEIASALQTLVEEAKARLTGLVDESLVRLREGHERMRLQNEERVRESLQTSYERLASSTKALLEETEKQLAAQARTASQSLSDDVNHCVQTLHDSAAQVRHGIDLHAADANARFRKQTEQQIEGALEDHRKSSAALLREIQARLMEAARVIQAGAPRSEAATVQVER